jgi:hypothetical protein
LSRYPAASPAALCQRLYRKGTYPIFRGTRVFGFLMGRVWQIRCNELERRAGFALPPVAHIAQPKSAAMPL